MTNRPRQVLLQALAADLEPLVKSLRERGWPAEVRIESDGTTDGSLVTLVEVHLDGIPVPVESA